MDDVAIPKSPDIESPGGRPLQVNMGIAENSTTKHQHSTQRFGPSVIDL